MMRWLALMSLVTVLGVAGCQKNDGPAADPTREVVIETIAPGLDDAPVAEDGDVVSMQYIGTLKDGTRFDANVDNPNNTGAYSFTLGKGEVIKGWDEGIKGMTVGEKRKLVIPWEKAYGAAGNGAAIPPKTDLYFDVALLGVIKKDEDHIYDAEILTPGTGPEIKKGDTVEIHYVGRYLTGTEFDNTREKNDNKPIKFTVGVPEVILGIDHGIVGMKKGEVRRLRIPPRLGWGMGGGAMVQGGQVTIFDIEVISVNGA